MARMVTERIAPLNLQRHRREALRRQFEPDMTGPDALQTIVHHAMRQIRPVAFTAQVTKVQMAQLGGHKLLRSIGGGFVREMPMPAEDPLL